LEKKDEILKELEAIKKLLVLQLHQQGVSAESIAKASGMSTKTIYKFVPKTQKKVSK